jgi:uncharacterized protein (TIGR02466 family)
MKILECFKTQIVLDHKPEFLKSLIKNTDGYIKKAKQKNKIKFKNFIDFGISHHSINLMSDTKFKDFHNYIYHKCNEFLEHQGFNMSVYRTFFEQSWVQEFSLKGGGYQSAHVHPNTHVNAFYFLKSSLNTSYPIFHDPRTGSRTLKLEMKNEDLSYSGNDLIHCKVKPGDILIFPGYLQHEFAVDNGKEPFRFIHVCITAIPKKIIENDE